MKAFKLVSLLICAVAILSHGESTAATCDQYMGDNSIYGGVTSSLNPNVLIIIDTSGSMTGTVPGILVDFASATTYTVVKKCYTTKGTSTNCSTNQIYKKNTSTNKWVDDGYALTSVSTSCNGANPKNLLTTTGQYTGRTLTTGSGACAASGADLYATGNWLNWNLGSAGLVQKIDVARNVVKDLINSSTGLNIGVMVYNGSNGSKFFSNTVSGASYVTTIKDMDAIHTGTTTNRTALAASITTSTIVASGNTPLGECLYEAGMYFGGKASAFSSTVGITSGKYTTPIKYSCQKNYVVFLTDGMATADDAAVLKTICTNGDCDGDGNEPGDLNHSLDDVAKYLYDTDVLDDNTATGYENTIGKQNIRTSMIGFGDVGSDATAVALLNRAGDKSHGRGGTYLAADQEALTNAFNSILYAMVSADTSFVAPVVPISPDNKTYGSNRIYMGYFKPQTQAAWYGNLKKYGLDANYNIIDKNGNPAFTSTSYAYWNDTGTPDGTTVELGGAGAELLTRSTARKIYTYTGTSTTLTATSNLFSTSNTAITSTGSDTATTRTMNVTDDATKNDLINYVIGYNMGSSGTVKRDWMFGDVLHSKALVVNYAQYSMTTANESNCSVNKSVIYVGSNDGLLHAINDCDGSEAWAFVPPDILPNIQDIAGEVHSFGVDATPTVYIYDANKNGTIETSTDKVIMLVGMRRGGGPNDTAGVPAKGSYYALDVTDPATPKFLWTLSNATSGFSELAESWGEPKFVKMKIGAVSKMVALLPGGYDNLNEDGRFGATQSFDSTGTVNESENGGGNKTSTATGAQLNPKGRGIYAIEIATLSSTGVPTIATTPTKIWGAVYGASTSYTTSSATDAGMTYSFASDITALDVDGNGYIDRLYATDLGGNLWRFDVGSTTPASWTGYKIFSANPASGSDTGRKMFYKPIATLETAITVTSRGNDATLFIGSGDREHPLNTAVTDRIYAVRDKGQTTTKYESDLTDVTANALQSATATTSAVTTLLNSLSSSYGWYIQLENDGEKVLAQPALTNKVAYFTTFAPGASTSSDPCKVSNLGTSRLYVLDYKTGEAVMNYDTTNDSTTVTNTRAKSGSSVLLKGDRNTELGGGIAPGVVVIGNKALIGIGGGITVKDAKTGSAGSSGGRIINLYWGQK